jgi:general secretion pathway protein A
MVGKHALLCAIYKDEQMVLDFYKLRDQPFGVTPDPRYLYLSDIHREALASLHYGVLENRGFTALIACPGLGKTTLLFDFLGKISDSARTAFLFQSQGTPRSFLRNLLEELRIPSEGDDLGQMQRQLNGCLTSESKAGRRLVVIIDEAQNLDESVLEVVRTLSNFETSSNKLLHCILTGQPQLAEILAKPSMEQLRQRISILARLHPLNMQGTQQYIEHRLRVAGYNSRDKLFTKRAITTIFQQSHGVPRNINNLCFNAMCLGCVAQMKTIDADVIGEVLLDLDLQSLVPEPSETPQPEMSEHTKLKRQPPIDRVTTAKSARSGLFKEWQLKVSSL